MSNLYLGSIDLTKIDKSRLKEFTRKDGTKGISLDVAVWIDDDPTEDWKALGIQQSTKKDEEKIYLGNGKKWQTQPHDQTPQSSQALEDGAIDDLPFVLTLLISSSFLLQSLPF